MNIELVNILRISVMVMAAYIIVVMGCVVMVYCKNLRTSPDKNRRILTGHIVLLSLSYGILVISAAWEMMIRYGLKMTWRTPTACVSLLVGILGLHLMLWRLALMRKTHGK